jgi:hypothetical protein
MSNNMYDILGKLNGLSPKQEAPKPAQPLYESVEARGSIVAGVKSVEQKLREQFEATKEERETLKTKTGTIYKGGSYGTAAYDDEPAAASSNKPKRGRPAAGEVRAPKVAKVKGPKGRPKKNANGPTGGNAPKGDIFGRTTGDVPKGKKGTVVKGKGNIDEVANPFAIGMSQAKKEVGLGRAKKLGEGRAKLLKMLAEGVNFREMIASKDQTLTELLSELQADIAEFKETGHCSDFLRDCMEVHGYGKKQLNDAVRGDSFAPQHPGTPVAKPSFLDKAKDFGKKAVGATLNTLGHGTDEKLKADLHRDVMGEDDDLNELARLAGLQVSEANDGNLANNAKPYDKVTRGDVVAGRLGKDEQGGKEEVDEAEMEEGNEFSGALDAAKDAGKKEFTVGGKTYPVKESQLDECGDMSPIGGMAQDMQQQQGRISVNTNSSSDGTKSVSINADGEAAEQLMAMLKMAGMGNSQAHAQQAQIVIAHEAKEYGDTEVDEPEEYVNSPREKVASMRQSPTTGLAGGTDDLNKSKDQDPATANRAANPKAKVEKQLEDVSPLDNLGAKLMAEYQSIKIAK